MLAPTATLAGGSITMRAMKQATDKIERLSREELAALTRPARVREREEKVAAVERATRGLRVDVRVTPSLYRPR